MPVEPNHLRVVRAQKRKTQFELAYRTGINQARISYIDNERVRTTAKERKKLARALGVSIGDLFPTFTHEDEPQEASG
jgi:transcriptional regulator with XRE-family HTH domain